MVQIKKRAPIQIPATATKEPSNPTKLSICLMGPPKFGKSDWANQLGDALFIDTEDGLKELKTRDLRCLNWETYLDIIDELESAEPNYDFLVLDTVSRLYDQCFKYVCKKNGFEHPADQAHGKGWSLIGKEWSEGIWRANSLNAGCIFIAHSKQKEVDVIRNGFKTKVQQEVMSLPPSGAENVNTLVDCILTGGYVQTANNQSTSEDRVWYTRSTSANQAGSRFLLPETIEWDPKHFKAALTQKEKKSASKPRRRRKQ
jgi:hypothetical protein